MKRTSLVALLAVFLLLPTSCNDSPDDDTKGNGNLWREPAKTVLDNALKDYSIPVFEADEYVAQNNDNYGTNMAVINCVGGFDGDASELIYSLSLKEDGFTVEDMKEEEGCIYGIKEVVPEKLAVVVQYAYIDQYVQMQHVTYFAIIAFLYENQNQQNPVYDSWPSSDIELSIGFEVPAYPYATQYELSSTTTIENVNCLDIYCYGAQDDAVTVYSSIVTEAGYVIEDFNEMYYATNEVEGIQLMFYMSFDNAFFIRAYSI